MISLSSVTDSSLRTRRRPRRVSDGADVVGGWGWTLVRGLEPGSGSTPCSHHGYGEKGLADPFSVFVAEAGFDVGEVLVEHVVGGVPVDVVVGHQLVLHGGPVA